MVWENPKHQVGMVCHGRSSQCSWHAAQRKGGKTGCLWASPVPMDGPCPGSTVPPIPPASLSSSGLHMQDFAFVQVERPVFPSSGKHVSSPCVLPAFLASLPTPRRDPCWLLPPDIHSAAGAPAAARQPARAHRESALCWRCPGLQAAAWLNQAGPSHSPLQPLQAWPWVRELIRICLNTCSGGELISSPFCCQC
jgi:hypothetical protein